MSVRDTIDRIRAYAQKNGLRKATLAKRAGLHPNALRDLDSPDWKPRLDTIEKLEKVLAEAGEESDDPHAGKVAA